MKRNILCEILLAAHARISGGNMEMHMVRRRVGQGAEVQFPYPDFTLLA